METNSNDDGIVSAAQHLSLAWRPSNQPGILGILTNGFVPVVIRDEDFDPDSIPRTFREDLWPDRDDSLSFFDIRPLNDETEERLGITTPSNGRAGYVAASWREDENKLIKDVAHELGHAWCFNENCSCVYALVQQAVSSGGFLLSIQTELHANLHALGVLKHEGFFTFVLNRINAFENNPKWKNRGLVAQYYNFCVLRKMRSRLCNDNLSWSPMGLGPVLSPDDYRTLIEENMNWFRFAYNNSLL